MVLPVFVTVTLIVTFCPALTVIGVIFRSEYLKVVYELHAVIWLVVIRYTSESIMKHTVHIQKETVVLLQNNDKFC